jgi:hypothetical protein
MKVRSLLIAAALGAFATAAAAVTDSISANDQAISNNSVTANSVTASKAGYLAVHTITGPHIGRMLGVVAVKAGENSDVSVPLTAAVKAGKKLVFILHEESNGDTVFDPRDKLVVVDGKLVTKSITVLK